MLGQTAADGEGQNSAGRQKQEDGQKIFPDQFPVIHNSHCGGNKKNGKNRGQEGAGLLDLLQSDQLQAQCGKQQRKTVD